MRQCYTLIVLDEQQEIGERSSSSYEDANVRWSVNAVVFDRHFARHFNEISNRQCVRLVVYIVQFQRFSEYIKTAQQRTCLKTGRIHHTVIKSIGEPAWSASRNKSKFVSATAI